MIHNIDEEPSMLSKWALHSPMKYLSYSSEYICICKIQEKS